MLRPRSLLRRSDAAQFVERRSKTAERDRQAKSGGNKLPKNLNEPDIGACEGVRGGCAERARIRKAAWGAGEKGGRGDARRVGPAWMRISTGSGRNLQQVKSNDKLPADGAARLVSRRWDEWSSLQDVCDAEESRADSDTYFVNDVRSATARAGGTARRRARTMRR